MYNIFGHVELMNISYLAEKQFISMILCSIQNKVLRHSSTSSMFLFFFLNFGHFSAYKKAQGSYKKKMCNRNQTLIINHSAFIYKVSVLNNMITLAKMEQSSLLSFFKSNQGFHGFLET